VKSVNVIRKNLVFFFQNKQNRKNVADVYICSHAPKQ